MQALQSCYPVPSYKQNQIPSDILLENEFDLNNNFKKMSDYKNLPPQRNTSLVSNLQFLFGQF